MSKGKLYKIDNKSNDSKLLKFFVEIIVYAVVIFVASNIFESFYVQNFLYAIICALILTVLNSTIKPVFVFLTLPLNILTFGITYPIVNMIILKICDVMMGTSFETTGFLSLFFISIFISIFKMILDKLITKRIGAK